MDIKLEKDLQYYLDEFDNSEKFNDHVYEEFTNKTNEIEYLIDHRTYIENNSLGFGDRAFHYMWFLLIKHLIKNEIKLSFLEIGVYKGQVISLWNIIAKHQHLSPIKITGVTPLEGKLQFKNSLFNYIYRLLNKNYREDVDNANFYDRADYLSIIKSLYKRFYLDYSTTNIIKGYSNQSKIVKQVQLNEYSLIYIDGDHSYKGVLHDIQTYSPLLINDGFLIMDDASCNIPGKKFWKGHKSVSDACEKLPELGFQNVLNIGHNRIYRRKSLIKAI